MPRAPAVLLLPLLALLSTSACTSDPDPTESKPDTGGTPGDSAAPLDTAGGSDVGTDTNVGTDTKPIDDAGSDAIDSTPVDAPAPSTCPAGDLSNAVVVGGPAGTTNVYSISRDTTHPDGYLGTVRLSGKDLEVSDIERTGKYWVVDGTKIYTLGPWPYVSKGEYYVDATVAGDAPGIKALSSAGPTTLFGAGGLTLYQIDMTTMAVKALYTMKTAGCTEIIDFWAANSGGALTFGMFMQCGAETKLVPVTWSDLATTTSFSEDVPKSAVVGAARAYTFGDFAIGAKVYQLKFGTTSFAYVRDVDPCVDPARLRGGR